MKKNKANKNKFSTLLAGAFLGLLPTLSAYSSDNKLTDKQLNDTSTYNLLEQVADKQPFASKIFVNDDKMARKIAISFHHAILETNYEDNYIIADLSIKEIKQLRSLGLKIIDATEWNDRYLQFKKSVELKIQQQAPGARMLGIPGFDCYPTVEETLEEGSQLAIDYPDLAEWIDIGDSWDKINKQAGYDLMVLKITNKSISENKPKLFIHSSMHAREYTPAALTLDYAKQLLTEYSNNPDIQWIVDYHEIHILFHMNPDGRKIAETGSLQRKNTNANHCSSGSIGVDLNRNFAYFWNTTSNGSSGFDCDQTFRGISPESEPETQAVSNYIRSLFPDVRGDSDQDASPQDTPGLHLDIHSYSQLVLWPWGHKSGVSPNNDGFVALGNKFAWFNDYTPQQSIGLYATDGTSDDVSYGEIGIAAFTFELGTSFFQSCNDYQNVVKPDNLPALIYAAKVAAAPFLLAHGPEVTDIQLNGSLSGVTVPAGTPVSLIVTANAVRSKLSSQGRTISKVEYSIDTPIWKDTANIIEVTDNDGDLSSGIEEFSAQVDTSNLTSGNHLIYIRAYDGSDNVGVPTASFINIDADGNTSPIADFNFSCEQLVCNYDANNSNDPDGNIVSYQWNFGDGNSATGIAPDNVYSSAGTYTVSLTVTDNSGATGVVSQTNTVSTSSGEVTDGFTETDLVVSRGESLFYSIEVPANATSLVVGLSGGSGDVDLLVNYGTEPTRTDFDCFESGAGNTHNCTLTNPQAGIWHILIRGRQASSGVQLDAYWFAESSGNSAPQAGFSFNSTLLEATFTDSSTDSDGSVVSWSWDFGDGNSSVEQSPIHIYAAAGDYSVVLTVTDDQGEVDSINQVIAVSDSTEPTSGGFTETGIDLAVRENISFTIEVPVGASSLVVDTSAGTGNVDLVINFGSTPTRNNNDCIRQGSGNVHNCTITNPEAGTWYLVARGAAISTGVQLDAYWFNN